MSDEPAATLLSAHFIFQSELTKLQAGDQVTIGDYWIRLSRGGEDISLKWSTGAEETRLSLGTSVNHQVLAQVLSALTGLRFRPLGTTGPRNEHHVYEVVT